MPPEPGWIRGGAGSSRRRGGRGELWNEKAGAGAGWMRRAEEE